MTHVTFFIGCLALAGFPGLSGFWSKDAIVAALHEKSHELHHHIAHAPGSSHEAAGAGSHGTPAAAGDLPPGEGEDAHSIPGQNLERYANAYQSLYYVSLLTAFLTAFYAFRALYLTFYGPERIPFEAGGHAHESPPIMRWPLRILAIGAATIGFLLDQTWRQHPRHLFAEFLGQTPSLAGGEVAATRTPFVFHADVAAVSGAIAVVGVILATYLYLGGRREVEWLKSVMDFQIPTAVSAGGRERLDRMRTAAQRFGFGWLANFVVGCVSLLGLVLATPLLLGHFISPYKLSYGKFFIDELYRFTIVWPLRWLAWLSYGIDRWLVDGLVQLVGRIPPAAGSWVRSLQVGLVPFYTLAMVLGTLVLLAAMVL